MTSWKTPAGEIKGFLRDGVAHATGIRYATAKRYQVPQPEPMSTTIIDATKPAPACPQPPDRFSIALGSNVIAGMEQSEDCLRLSIHCPDTISKQLPVMVWIHGGAYCNGAGDSEWYDPSALVNQERVIVVNITYRLGLLGYLNDHEHKPANLGLLDQICALKWVNKNISAFGGDSQNVTLFGQSAGADAILHLMISDGTSGLFRRAIVQSAPFVVLKGRSEMVIAMSEASAELPKDAPLAEIHKKQLHVLENVRKFGAPSYMPFGVQWGVYPLPKEEDIEAAYVKVAKDVDILLGYTKREAAIFGFVVELLRLLLTLPVISFVANRYFIPRLTERIYGQGAREFTALYKKAGGSIHNYILDSVSKDKLTAAGHCADLPLLFREPEVWDGSRLLKGVPRAVLLKQAAELKHIWAQFARTGKVDAKNEPGFIQIA